jgi:hypothetical protein
MAGTLTYGHHDDRTPRPSQRRGRDLVINFAQTRLGTLRYIFAITDSGPESGAGGRETGRAPA